jgi:hypothetical protein
MQAPDRLMPTSWSLVRWIAALAASFVLVAAPARATTEPDYGDTWWAAGGIESGWGVNFSTSPGIIFVSFYIYGPDKKPTWYVAVLQKVASARYSGALYRTTGSWFGGPWQPLDVTEVQVGEAVFEPENVYRGVFRYRIETTEVVKTIERLTLTRAEVAGTFLGGSLIKSSSACNGGAASDILPYQYIVTQDAANKVRIEHIRTDGVTDCVMEGTAQLHGKLLHLPNATYKCEVYGIDTTVVLTDLRRTSNGGIEGTWRADLGGSCTEDGRFSAITQQ